MLIYKRDYCIGGFIRDMAGTLYWLLWLIIARRVIKHYSERRNRLLTQCSPNVIQLWHTDSLCGFPCQAFNCGKKTRFADPARNFLLWIARFTYSQNSVFILNVKGLPTEEGLRSDQSRTLDELLWCGWACLPSYVPKSGEEYSLLDFGRTYPIFLSPERKQFLSEEGIIVVGN